MKKKLEPFIQHGFSPTQENDTQYYGDCPLCGGRGKFYVGKETALWDCKKCGKAGNLNNFLAYRMEYYQAEFTGERQRALWRDRGLRPKTLREWGVGFFPQTGEYLIPSTGNPQNSVSNIKRYRIRGKCLSTTGCKLAFTVPWGRDVGRHGEIYLTEGEWDAMALHEATSGDVCAVSCPGAGVLPATMADMLTGKIVNILFDADEAGKKGATRIGKRLSGIAKAVRYLHWNPDLPDGYDIRDWYRDNNEVKTLFSQLSDKPPYGAAEGSTEDAADVIIYGGTGYEYKEAEAVFRKWLYMPNANVFSVLFGAAFANRLDGDPIWLFLVAPPGGSKTELLMALSDAPGILTTTTLTPHALISGANFGGGDPSLIPKLNDRCLVIKDFTTILSMSTQDRDNIFGILRDIYDGKAEKYFGNGIVRRYESKFGILAGVTPVVETLGAASSVLGERFLRYRIASGDSRGLRGGHKRVVRALQNVRTDGAMRGELRDVAKRVLDVDTSNLPFPEISDAYYERIAALAQLVAGLRGVVCRERYTQMVTFRPMHEVGTRLAKQLCKLLVGICYYRGLEEVTEQVYKILVAVARGTIPDRVEAVVRYLYNEGSADTGEISSGVRLPLETLRFIMQDMLLLGLAEKRGRGIWALTRDVKELIQQGKVY